MTSNTNKINILKSKDCNKICCICKKDISEVIEMPSNQQIFYNGHTWMNYISLGCYNGFPKQNNAKQ